MPTIVSSFSNIVSLKQKELCSLSPISDLVALLLLLSSLRASSTAKHSKAVIAPQPPHIYRLSSSSKQAGHNMLLPTTGRQLLPQQQQQQPLARAAVPAAARQPVSLLRQAVSSGRPQGNSRRRVLLQARKRSTGAILWSWRCFLLPGACNPPATHELATQLPTAPTSCQTAASLRVDIPWGYKRPAEQSTDLSTTEQLQSQPHTALLCQLPG